MKIDKELAVPLMAGIGIGILIAAPLFIVLRWMWG